MGFLVFLTFNSIWVITVLRAQITVKHSMLLLMLSLAGCGPITALSNSEHKTIAATQPNSQPAPQIESTNTAPVSSENNSKKQQDLWNRMSAGFKFAPSIQNEDVAKQREWLKHNKAFIEEFSSNARPYLYYIASEMEREGIPLELALIPVIESAYNPVARGGGGAGGMWQLMAGTGRTLGVRMTHQYDGRRDVVASTEGAIKYLKQLNKEFDGDWLLTIAAYNQGELFVEASLAHARAQKKPTDFWSIRMPKVTCVFVPRIIALAQMVKDDKHFGLPLQSIPNEPAFRQLVVQGPVDLAQVASLSSISLSTLTKLNSGYSGKITEAGRHTILVPYNTSDQFLSQLSTVKQTVAANDTDIKTHSGKRKLSKKQDPHKEKTFYMVKKGDNLKTISKRFKVDNLELARWNGIKTNSVLKVGQQLVIWNDG